MARALERCWSRADPPVEWGLTRAEFEAALERSARHRFLGLSGGSPSGAAVPTDRQSEAYLDSLNARDLALACACGAGNEAAWEFFVAQYRQELYRAAGAIVGQADSGSPAARELADSLYADLYGMRETGGARRSLFDYFHGRSKLSTWLRAVLAQRHVDVIRRAQKTQPIENERGEECFDVAKRSDTASIHAAQPDPERDKHMALLQAALATALDRLEPRDRLRLMYYYVDERTLAEIGRMLGEHEATASRKLDRTRRDLRRAVETTLRDGKKLSEGQVEACFEYARGKWPFDLTERLRSQ
jgi:RNA polymerase sigma-70 factor, ECF subfamily